jgi:anti-sigma regulatory factor (Ser/Thr protein kinase)
MTEKLIFKSEISEIKKVREFFVNTAKKYLEIEDYFNFELVIGEIITNIVKYGVKDKIEDIFFEIEFQKNSIFMKFEYNGENITDEEVKKHQRLKKPDDVFEISESGRGTFIINSIMDKVEYIQKDSKSEIKLYKKII